MAQNPVNRDFPHFAVGPALVPSGVVMTGTDFCFAAAGVLVGVRAAGAGAGGKLGCGRVGGVKEAPRGPKDVAGSERRQSVGAGQVVEMGEASLRGQVRWQGHG